MSERQRTNQLTPQEMIRRHVEGAQDWEWREIATTLYQWTDRFQDRFFEHKIPKALLSFEHLDFRILAAYTLRRNPQGLLYEITFNTQHLYRPLWETLETLMHEYAHLWQQNLGEHPVNRNYHNQEFVNKCESLGLHPSIGSGVHLRPADGPFAAFLRAYGLEEPAVAAGILVDSKGRPLDWWTRPEERRKTSTLIHWSCGCQSVRLSRQEFHACCTRCGREFARLEAPIRRRPLPTSQGRFTLEEGEHELATSDNLCPKPR